jgi:hypothetical protein
VRRVWRAHRYPPASLSHRFGKTPSLGKTQSPAQSPVDALIDLVVGGRLRCPISVGCPVRRGRNTLIRLRIAVIP